MTIPEERALIVAEMRRLEAQLHACRCPDELVRLDRLHQTQIGLLLSLLCIERYNREYVAGKVGIG